MTFSDSELATMLVEAIAGEPKTSVEGERARAYFEHLRAEVQEMMEKGYMPLPGPE